MTMEDFISSKKKPFIVFLSGQAGVGKSTLGDKISNEFGFEHLDFDIVTSDICQEFRIINPYISEASALEILKPVRYLILKQAILDSLTQGKTIVVSAPLTAQTASSEAWADWSSGLPNTVLFWLFLDKQTLIQRIFARGAERDRNYVWRPVAPPVIPHTPLDASQSVSDLLESVGKSFV